MNSMVAASPSQVQLAIEMNQEKLDLIKKTICRGCSNEEISIFLHACKRTGLDPLMRQIYPIKYGSQMTIQTGIDGFRLIADRNGCYSPGKEPTFTYDANGQLLSATAHIKKMTPDKVWHDVSATAFFSEYCKYDRQGKPSQFWKQMPHGQLAKCAEALALRKAFPGDYSNIYSKEEMEQAGNNLVDVTPEQEDPQPVKVISADQAVVLAGLVDQCSQEDHANIWKYFRDGCKIQHIYDLPADKFDMVLKRVKVLAEKNQSNEVADVVQDG